MVAFLFFNWLVPEKGQPGWVREAKTRPFLEQTGQQLMAMLPEDPLNTLQERVNRKLREGEPPPETGAPPRAPNRQRAGFDLTEVTICCGR